MKKKIIFAVSLLSAFTLAACNMFDPVGNLSNQTNSSNTSGGTTSSGGGTSSGGTSTGGTSTSGGVAPDLAITSSRTAKVYVDIDHSYNITLYFTNNYGTDIPYINFKDVYDYYYGGLFEIPVSALTKTKIDSDRYQYSSNYDTFVFNVKEDTLSDTNPSLGIIAINETSNHVPYVADGIETEYVRFNTTKTTLVNPKHGIEFNFANYHIDIFASEDEVYMPLTLFSTIFFSANGGNFAYNGKDLYLANSFAATNNGSNTRYSIVGDLETKFFNESPWKNKSTRSQQLATYTYNELCFQLDYFYGLKSFRSVSTFDQLFTSRGYKDGLCSLNTLTYEQKLNEFVGAWLYEGHSGYIKVSPFQIGTASLSTSYNSHYSENPYSQLSSTYWALDSLRSAEYEPGLVISSDNKTALITFDTFMKAQVDTTDIDVDDYTYAELDGACSELLFRKAFKAIKANSSIENVVISLAMNGGGMADSIPWLEAYMTDDPIFVTQNTLRGDLSDVHYQVDLNRDGVFGNAGDTYKGQYNFFLLTSNYSFSCGNALPTFVKDTGMATIIGETSGGGSCVVGGLVTASGTTLRLSATSQILRKSGLSYTPNEEGIEPDFTFPRANFFNIEAINEFVSNPAHRI